MRCSRLKIARHCLLLITMAIVSGCVAERVHVEFPANHPANPQALETPFTPPPNLFQTDMAVKPPEPATGSSMMHQHHQSGQAHSTGHQMDAEKDTKEQPESKMQPSQEATKQHHQEHNQ